jgi:uncharacterized protein YqeY
MTLAQQINDGIKEAMKSKDQLRLETLRMLKSKILAQDARGNLSDAEVVKLFKTYFGNLLEALEGAQTMGRHEASEKLKKEMAIVNEFLPKALSHEETVKLIQQAIDETGAKTKKDLGLVMKAAKKYSDAIDGKIAKSIADELLAD